MRITVIGGSDIPNEIGASCYYCEDKDFMVDCGGGMSWNGQRSVSTPPPFLNLIKKPLHALFLTHSHGDHITFVPLLKESGLITKDTVIWSTPQTEEMSHEMFWDSKRNGISYSRSSIWSLPRFEHIPVSGEFEIVPGTKAYSKHVGHLHGARDLIIQDESGMNFAFTGDWCFHDQPTVKGMAAVSEWPVLPDIFVNTDWTYGLSGLEERQPFAFEMVRMQNVVKDRFSRGMFLRLFGFGQGRVPNIALNLGRVFGPMGVPVYLDGGLSKSSWRVAHEVQVTDRDVAIPGFGDESGVYPVENREHREELINSKEPNIIVTTPGMGDGGLAATYLMEGLPRRDHFIASTSYLSPHSTMYELQEMAAHNFGQGREITITEREQEDGEEKHTKHVVQVNAEIGRFSVPGHHGPADELSMLRDLVEARGGEKLLAYVVGHGSLESRRVGQRLVRDFVQNPDENVTTAEPGRSFTFEWTA